VFVLNNSNRKQGFSSQIEDDPVLQIFGRKTDTYPFAEERRLFYVALTRAKKTSFFDG
jgi:DNA helicase-4